MEANVVKFLAARAVGLEKCCSADAQARLGAANGRRQALESGRETLTGRRPGQRVIVVSVVKVGAHTEIAFLVEWRIVHRVFVCLTLMVGIGGSNSEVPRELFNT